MSPRAVAALALVAGLFIVVGAQRSSSCQQDALKRCTDPLKVLTNNRDLGFATTKNELDTMCPKLIDGLRCIDNFTGRCLDAQHREFFHMLYAGTKQVIVDLCQDEDYQADYLSHAPCMRDVQSGYEQCAIEYQSHIADQQAPTSSDQNDAVEHSNRLCCSFQNYMKCSQAVVKATCGHQTATFTRGFLDTMAGPLIQGYCLSYDQEAYDCRQMGVEPSYVRDAVDQALDRIDADVDHVDSEPAATAAGATGPRTGTSSSSSTGGSAHQWAWPLTALATLVLARH